MRTKRYFLLVLISVSVFLVSACNFSKNELVPGRYAGFKLSGYMDLATNIEIGGSIMGQPVEGDTLSLKKEFAKGTDSYVLYVVKFEKLTHTTSFWYDFVGEVSSELRAVVSALPLIYGEFSGETARGYLQAWFSGKWLYIFEGETKSEVKSIVKAFKDFEESLVRSVES